jgi:hypothetical protein
MKRKVLMSTFGISLLFGLLLISTTSSMTLAFGQASRSANTNASTATNSSPNLANQLKNNLIPKVLERISSLSNILAVSTVEGIKLSGVSMGNTNLTVTLKRQTNESNTGAVATAGNTSQTSLPVTIIVSKLPVNNLTQVVSMLQSTRNMERAVSNVNPSSASTIDLGSVLASNSGGQGNLLRTLSILKNVQIGMGAIVKPNWALPQTLTLNLIGLPASRIASASDTTDVIMVAIVPYRGLLGNLAATQ